MSIEATGGSVTTPRTEAGRKLSALLADADIRWPDEHTRVATSAVADWVNAIEQEAAAIDPERLARAMNKVRPYGGNPTEWARIAARQVADAYNADLSSSKTASSTATEDERCGQWFGGQYAHDYCRRDKGHTGQHSSVRFNADESSGLASESDQ